MSLKGFITELDLNNKQKTECLKHAGTGRFAYNWALDLVNETMADKKYWSSVDLHKHWVATFKKENIWVTEISKCSPQQAFRNFNESLKKFWIYKKENKGKKLPLQKLYKKKVLERKGDRYVLKKEWEGKTIPLNLHYKFPNFKKKNVKDKFYLDGCIRIEGKKIKLPKIGWVKTHEKMPDVSPKNVTVSLNSGKWFISFKYEAKKPKSIKKKKGKIGVDLGIKHLATLSDGKIFESSQKYKKLQKTLARFQRKLSRQYTAYEKREEEKAKDKNYKKEKNKIFLISNNYEKTKLKIQKLHYQIACVRKDILHKLTTYLAKNHSEITIEDLNVSGMMKNHKLAKAIANGSFYEFKRQLTYKCDLYNTKLNIADRYFASSKTCCCCGHVQEMPLKKRVFDCEECDNKMDRDLNAAINLMNYKKKNAGSQSVKACDDAKFHAERQVGVRETGIKHQTASG